MTDVHLLVYVFGMVATVVTGQSDLDVDQASQLDQHLLASLRLPLVVLVNLDAVPVMMAPRAEFLDVPFSNRGEAVGLIDCAVPMVTEA